MLQADIDGQRLVEDLRLNVMKPIAFDAILRLRTSTGKLQTAFFRRVCKLRIACVPFCTLTTV